MWNGTGNVWTALKRIWHLARSSEQPSSNRRNFSMGKGKHSEPQQLSFFGEDVCVCGCLLSAHNQRGGCQRCLECRQFLANTLATFAREAATVVNISEGKKNGNGRNKV
jgi:hypothetical protein